MSNLWGRSMYCLIRIWYGLLSTQHRVLPVSAPYQLNGYGAAFSA